MGIVQKMNSITHARQPMLVLLLRVALGLLLLLKGLSFLSNSKELESLIVESRFGSATAYLVSYITIVHLFGGTFIIIGLLTRWMVALQLPVLLGAVVFLSQRWHLFSIGSEFILSVVTLMLLLFFLYEGGGMISMDRYLKRNRL